MAKISAWESSGPGKFSSRADERVYRMSLDGTRKTAGDIFEMGEFAALIDGRILGLAQAGAILTEDDQGFVGVEYFDDEDVMLARWQEIEETVSEFYAEEPKA